MVKSKQLVKEYRQQIGKYTYEQMDCIKSIENIITRYGGKNALTGSNWWARHEIQNMRPLISKDQLYDGCAVLKTKAPGESGYNLPARYSSDANQVDFYHIGLGTDQGEILDSTTIRGADGGYIRNGPGVSTAKIGPDSWDIIGDFEDVDYSDRDAAPVDLPPQEQPEYRVVYAPTGDTVNLRAKPSAKAVVLSYVKVGSVVELIVGDGTWSRVVAPDGKRGWMKSEFLPAPSLSSAKTDMMDKLESAIALLQEIASAMERAG